MFVNQNLAVPSFGFPDVTHAPTPAGPVPTPFPNLATSITDIPAAFGAIIGGGLGGLDPSLFLNMMGGGEADTVGASLTPAQAAVMTLG